MDRRRFLAAVPLAGMAGCLDRLEAAGDTLGDRTGDGHPLADDQLQVGLRRQTTVGPSPSDVIPRSLSFWETHAERYAGFRVSFRYAPNAGENVDIEVIAVESLGRCGETEHDGAVAGCAPLLRPGHEVPAPIEVVVVFDQELDAVIRTSKHEFGHVLGIGHDGEPAEIMANDPAEYIPEYDTKQDALDHYRSGIDSYGMAVETFNEGVASFEDSEYGSAADHLDDAVAETERTTTRFEDALELVEGIGSEPGAAICSDALTYTDRFETAVDALRTAASEYEAGNHSAGDEALDDHQEAMEWVQAHSLPDSRELYESLGLDGPSFTD